MTDSLKLYDILKEAQIAEPAARAITKAMLESESARAANLRSSFDEWAARLVTKEDEANLKTELVRWLLAFWVGHTAVVVGIIFAAAKLGR